MECMPEIIYRKLDRISVDYYTTMVYTIGVTPDRSSEISLVILGQISLYAIEAEHYIAHLSISVRYLKCHYTATVISNRRFHSVTALYGVQSSGLAVNLSSKLFRTKTCNQSFGYFLLTRTGYHRHCCDSCNCHKTMLLHGQVVCFLLIYTVIRF